MNDTEKIQIVKDLNVAQAMLTKADCFNQGIKGRYKTQQRALVAVLKLVLGRLPTPEELANADDY